MTRIQGDVAGAYVREAIMLCKVNNKNKIQNLFFYLSTFELRFTLKFCKVINDMYNMLKIIQEFFTIAFMQICTIMIDLVLGVLSNL